MELYKASDGTEQLKMLESTHGCLYGVHEVLRRWVGVVVVN